MVEWDDIPAAERLELLATIREVRAWRYGDCEPLRPLQPITQAALALYEFRVRSGATNQEHDWSPTSHSDMQ